MLSHHKVLPCTITINSSFVLLAISYCTPPPCCVCLHPGGTGECRWRATHKHTASTHTAYQASLSTSLYSAMFMCLLTKLLLKYFCLQALYTSSISLKKYRVCITKMSFNGTEYEVNLYFSKVDCFNYIHILGTFVSNIYHRIMS